MAIGTFALACLLVAAGQDPNGIFYTNQRNHRIPLDIKPERRPEIREMLLYISTDKGKTWQQYSKITPDQDGFVFYAPGDGEYWLRAAAIDRQGHQQPDNLYEGKPDRVMVIDTLKPMINLTAQRKGEEVIASWNIQEEHPRPDTLRLEYQAENGPWINVPLTPGPTGQVPIKVNPAAPVTVRMKLEDGAGNVSYRDAQVAGAGGITTAAFNPIPGPAANNNNGAPTGAGKGSVPPPIPDGPAAPTGNGVSLPGTIVTPNTNPPTGGNRFADPASNPNKASVMEGNNRPVASTQNMAPAAHPPVRTDTYSGLRSLPPVQFVNYPKVVLGYQISRQGPSGIGNVELWYTPDDGKTWKLTDSPPRPDPSRDGRHERAVALDTGDGIYGFTMVFRNRAGVGKTPPRPGDSPEMRVELDTTPPVAELYGPRPDPQNRDALLLTWNARDKNLAPNPISLEYRETPDGPWRVIVADHDNTGHYSWKPPPGINPLVYLRLRVRDLAANEGQAVTREPQMVDLTEPEGRLVNVSVLPR